MVRKLVLVVLAALATASTATATTFVTRSGAIAAGPYASWAATSRVPTVPGRVQIWPAALCGGAPGCSEFYDAPRGPAVLHAEGRGVFYFEMGHLFDYELLAWRERGTLARVWGVYGHPWSNSFAALQSGEEDGLAADFAAAYQFCAENGSAPGGEYVQAGLAPVIELRNTCSLIRRWS